MLRTAHRALVHNNIMSVQCNVHSTTHYRDVERCLCLKIKGHSWGTITYRVCSTCRCFRIVELQYEFVGALFCRERKHSARLYLGRRTLSVRQFFRRTAAKRHIIFPRNGALRFMFMIRIIVASIESWRRRRRPLLCSVSMRGCFVMSPPITEIFK